MASGGARLAAAVASLWLAASPVSAHQLPGSRATLVLRDGTHLTVTLYVGLPELLHRTLAARTSFSGFLVQYSTMDPAAFQREFLRAQSRIEQGTVLFLEDGRTLPLGRWAWPAPAAAQAMLRERVMREAVGGNGDAHDQPAEIHAEALSPRVIRSVSARFPAELQRVLVVAYRPTQTSVAAGERSEAIRF